MTKKMQVLDEILEVSEKIWNFGYAHIDEMTRKSGPFDRLVESDSHGRSLGHLLSGIGYGSVGGTS